MSRQWLVRDDRLIASVKQPLRVVAGQVAVMSAGVNEDGSARYTTDWVNLAPAGHETDWRLAYEMPLGKMQQLSLQTTLRRDYLHIAGNNNAGIGATWAVKF